jgi:predicted nucleotidyltransferase
MTDQRPPDNVVPFDRARAKKRSGKEMFELLSRIDELEEALETMVDVGVSTRDELEDLIRRLESEAARQDTTTEDPEE